MPTNVPPIYRGKRPFDPDRMCGHVKRDKSGFCTQPKGFRTDHLGSGHCWVHGGRSKSHQVAAAREAAARAVAQMGLHVEKDPQTALLEAVWEAAGNVAFLRQEVQRLDGALVGDAMGIAQREGVTLAIGEEQRAIVKLYGEWVDRLAKYAKAAIDAGIAERQVRLAEAQGYAIRDLIEAVLAALPIDDEQRKVGREVAARQLTVLAGGAAA